MKRTAPYDVGDNIRQDLPSFETSRPPSPAQNVSSTNPMSSTPAMEIGHEKRTATGDRPGVPSTRAIAGSSPTPSPPMRNGQGVHPKPSVRPAYT